MQSEYSNFLNLDVYYKYMALDQGATVQAEYIWLGGNGEFRCKTKSLSAECKTIDDYPIWNYDGSSTEQAPGNDSEVYLQPVAVYPDPFRGGKNVLVLCETVLVQDAKEGEKEMKFKPHSGNTRAIARQILNDPKVVSSAPWYGIEQEYTLFYSDRVTPFGWPHNGFPRRQGPFYCSVGAENAFGRRVADAHYRACLYSGIKISGINGEVMPGQWEYQVGPCLLLESGDQLNVSRYIMQRVCEDFGVVVSFHPKPISGDWNGAGCHTNYSTKEMREEGGYKAIEAAIKELDKRHALHISCYGQDNDKRLTGHHETASIDKFSAGVANRGCSVRIPKQTHIEKKGYLEDRRPASNMDPYLVTALIAETTILTPETSVFASK